ncbi:glycerol kinase GlpK [Clostridium thermosuccinogenes]|uniref:glycerol kinase GlpK n=1 Tax=Clostridium thermosuccinogenes TaxID=84032 RepID=UPI000CCC86C5|nr:glycerol kinase GlpK [Pseudoclostridium thermosuccinogenes]PNT94087.1 glycerol kinase [Pseudoclostridium thermosuccinogenes]
MQKKYILALDQGTTSSRAVIFNRRSEILGIKSVPLRQIYPEPGWVEHDPEEIWKGQLEALRGVIEDTGISPEEIACIGITNQRETVIVWDKNTGRPVYNGIVWQCRRTAAKCDEIKARGLDTMIRDKTGLVVDAYFSATKIQWILDNVEGVRERALAGELLAGTVDTWLVWNLTGGQLHVTDYTNASRTMLFNINTLEWDRELLETFGIPESMLPKVIPSSGIVGETVEEILGVRIPISGIAGDQQSALFGQGCFEKGCAKNTYGTGCFILMNVGKIPVKSNNNLLTTIAWGIGEEIEYALEGSVFNAGSSIQWLRDELKIIETARQADIDAEKVDDTGGVYVVPAYTGLGAPYWDPYARGIIIGITRGTRREHIIRATLESIAFQSRDVFEAMKADAGTEVKVLQVDGGVSVSPFCMQFQADILGIPVNRPAVTETTALGAAHLAGLAVGIWKDKLDIRKEFAEGKTFMPAMDEKTREDKYARWKRAVERSRNWVAE